MRVAKYQIKCDGEISSMYYYSWQDLLRWALCEEGYGAMLSIVTPNDVTVQTTKLLQSFDEALRTALYLYAPAWDAA